MISITRKIQQLSTMKDNYEQLRFHLHLHWTAHSQLVHSGRVFHCTRFSETGQVFVVVVK